MYKLITFLMLVATVLAAPAPEPEPGALLAPGLAPAIYKAPLYPAHAPVAYPAYPPLTYGAPLVYPYPAVAYSKIY